MPGATAAPPLARSAAKPCSSAGPLRERLTQHHADGDPGHIVRGRRSKVKSAAVLSGETLSAFCCHRMLFKKKFCRNVYLSILSRIPNTDWSILWLTTYKHIAWRQQDMWGEYTVIRKEPGGDQVGAVSTTHTHTQFSQLLSGTVCFSAGVTVTSLVLPALGNESLLVWHTETHTDITSRRPNKGFRHLFAKSLAQSWPFGMAWIIYECTRGAIK